MPIRTNLFSIAILIIWLSSFHSGAAAAKRIIRVGLFQNAPIVFQDKDGFPRGIYIDLLTEIAKLEDWKLIYIPDTWTNCLENLRNRKIDLMTCITYTKDRDTYIDLSKESVLMNWGQVYVGKDKEIQNILDLEGSKVAVLSGDINAINFQNLVEKFKINCELIPVNNQLEILELTSSGKTDAGVLNNIFGTAHENNYNVERSPIIFNPFSVLFAVPKGFSNEITAVIDSQLRLWKKDKNSAYYKILGKWHGTLTTQEDVVPTWLLFLLGGIGCTVIFLSVWMAILKRQVKLRTSELVESNKSLRNEVVEKNLAEKALQESKLKVETLLGNLSGMAYRGKNEPTWSPDFVSKGCYDLTGHHPEEFTGPSKITFAELIHPEDRQMVWDTIQEQLKDKKTYELSYRINTANGEEKWVWEKGKAVYDAKGEIIAVESFINDITESEEVKELLVLSEKRYKTFFNDAPVPLWEEDFTDLFSYLKELTEKGIVDFRDYFESNPEEIEICAQKIKILNVNQETLDLHEAKDKSDLLGNLDKLFSEKSFSVFKEEVIALASGKLKFESEGEVKTLSGKAKNIFLTCTIDKRQKDSIKALLATINITERKQIEAQLIQARKMESIGRLAGGVAHDYNNALSVIVGFTELAMEAVDKTEPLYDDLNEVLTAANRATSITRQLLAFASKQTIAPTVIDLNENLESMLKMLRRLIGEDIELIWSPETQLRPVKFDPTQINQILVNLCVNARDSIDGIGKINIETKNANFDDADCANNDGFLPGNFVMLSVTDNGCGMKKELIENIFEPFFTTKDIDKGTGLGLATVYGIVRQNNGFIDVYSMPDRGTTISVYLPWHVVNTVEHKKEQTVSASPGQGETVFLIEDDLPILKLTRKILENLSYTVLTAGTPGEAMKLAREYDNQIDLFITDVIMPEMNGRDLAKKLQSLYPDAKCLYMSGYTANVIAHHGVLNENVNFIQKPFSKNTLAKAVRKSLGE